MERCDDWFLELITYAACAGGCRQWARLEPEAGRGLLKVADRYSAVSADILTKWAGTVLPHPAEE